MFVKTVEKVQKLWKLCRELAPLEAWLSAAQCQTLPGPWSLGLFQGFVIESLVPHFLCPPRAVFSGQEFATSPVSCISNPFPFPISHFPSDDSRKSNVRLWSCVVLSSPLCRLTLDEQTYCILTSACGPSFPTLQGYLLSHTCIV